jgi:class 3 adenylate cyclase
MNDCIFIGTDIEGSTQLLVEYGDEAIDAIYAHQDVLRGLVLSHGGKPFNATGDGILAFFSMSHHSQPLQCALDIQDFFKRSWPLRHLPLSIRVALHCGYAKQRDGDYIGLAVNVTARLLRVCPGGGIVASPELLSHISLPVDVQIVDRGFHTLKGIPTLQQVFSLSLDYISVSQSRRVGVSVT